MSLDSIVEKFQRVKELLTVQAPYALDRISEILGTAKEAVDDAAKWLRGGNLLKDEGPKKMSKAKEEKANQKKAQLDSLMFQLDSLQSEFRKMGALQPATIVAMRKSRSRMTGPTDLSPALQINLAKAMASVLEDVSKRAKEKVEGPDNQENEETKG